MSLFQCEECGCCENTALCGYNFRGEGKALCSECDPKIGKWHGSFEKKKFCPKCHLGVGVCICKKRYIGREIGEKQK